MPCNLCLGRRLFSYPDPLSRTLCSAAPRRPAKLNARTAYTQVNNILQARNDELEKTMAAKGVGFLAEAAKAEGAVQTAR